MYIVVTFEWRQFFSVCFLVWYVVVWLFGSFGYPSDKNMEIPNLQWPLSSSVPLVVGKEVEYV